MCSDQKTLKSVVLACFSYFFTEKLSRTRVTHNTSPPRHENERLPRTFS